MYNLNQIPYDYTVEVTNRLRVRSDRQNAWGTIMEVHNIVCRWRPKPSPRKDMQQGKIVVWGGLTSLAEKWREEKGTGDRERYTHLNAEFQRIARRDKKAFFSEQHKEIEGKNRMGETRDLLQENQRYQRNISCKDGQN